MNGSLGRAAATGLWWGVLYCALAFGIDPLLPVDGVSQLYTIFIVGGVFYALAIESLGARTIVSEPSAARSKRSIIAFGGTIVLALAAGFFWRNSIGFPAFVVSFTFLVPLFLMLWQGRWASEVVESDLSKTGIDEYCIRYLAFGAGAGLLAGLVFRTGLFGVLFSALLGAAIGLIVWMDANERRRRLDAER